MVVESGVLIVEPGDDPDVDVRVPVQLHVVAVVVDVATCSWLVGAVTPMPTSPARVMRIRSSGWLVVTAVLKTSDAGFLVPR